ncbi:MAG: DUF1624 domain-containing protein [Acidobacteria bacterium]|nr:MAG: DUF1624 domain-containing protein [Acidobacteriota bacterium]
MIIMALDHTRDFVNVSAMSFAPEDLTKTTVALFVTRWITHFCAPVFMFTAGIGAFLRLERDGDRRALSRFLWTRGLWLVALELTAVRFVFFFNVNYDTTFLLVFWVLGLAMIALAALIYLPFPVLVAFSVGMIALHNLADSVTPAQFGAYGRWWNLLHQPGLLNTDPLLIVGYPLMPWIAVMAAGFCFGRVYRLPGDERRKLLIRSGLALTAAFFVIRYANIYGDLRPWSVQPQPGFTVLSFFNATKNPPSLDFLLMTLGPAILFLGLIDRAQPKTSSPFVVFGRTPLFYFIVHFAVIHALSIAMALGRYGWQPWVFTPPPTIGGAGFPAGYGWSLPTTYLVWAVVVATMYPMCRWLATLKATRREWWLSYL